MNCINHPDTPAVAYCRTCGKALCEACQRTAQGTVYCAEHLPALASTPGSAQPLVPPPPAPGPPPPSEAGAYAEDLKQRIVNQAAAGSPPPWKTALGSVPPPYAVPGATPYTAGDPGTSPGLAFVLGMIPGVGAIYNGQYVKGLIHVIILGILISIVSSDASAGLGPLFGMLIAVWWAYMAFEAYHTAKKRQFGHPVDEFSSIVPLHSNRRGFPVGPVILIAFGVLFLMNTMDILRFDRMIRYWPVLLIVLGGYMLYERIAGSETPAQKEARDEPR
jgi:TM2 domain-containing membrane protein YozV